jgi:hypothetical protein
LPAASTGHQCQYLFARLILLCVSISNLCVLHKGGPPNRGAPFLASFARSGDFLVSILSRRRETECAIIPIPPLPALYICNRTPRDTVR